MARARKPFDAEGFAHIASYRWYDQRLALDPDKGSVTRESADDWWRYNVDGAGWTSPGMEPPAGEADLAEARRHYDALVRETVHDVMVWRRDDEYWAEWEEPGW